MRLHIIFVYMLASYHEATYITIVYMLALCPGPGDEAMHIAIVYTLTSCPGPGDEASYMCALLTNLIYGVPEAYH